MPATSWANTHPTPPRAPHLTAHTDPDFPRVEIRRDSINPNAWHTTDHNYTPPAVWTHPTLTAAQAHAAWHGRAPECPHGMRHVPADRHGERWECPKRRCPTHTRKET